MARSRCPSPSKSPDTIEVRANSRGEPFPLTECAIAVAKQYCDVVGQGVGGHQVEPTITVEVPRYEGHWIASHNEWF